MVNLVHWSFAFDITIIVLLVVSIKTAFVGESSHLANIYLPYTDQSYHLIRLQSRTSVGNVHIRVQVGMVCLAFT